MQRIGFLILFVFIFIQVTGVAQIGGTRAFTFLELPASARLSGLGGINVSSSGNDILQTAANPALLLPEMHRQMALNVTDFVADISQTTIHYGFKLKENRMFAAGLTYFNYGNFTQRDAAGQSQGKFSVNDFAFSLTHATTIDNFTLGATTKIAVSSIAEFKSVGLVADIGGIFKHPAKDFTIGLALKNIGYQVMAFQNTDRAAMPFDAQLGFTYKPEHMPLRFSITAHHLQQFDIVYLDTTGTSLNSSTKVKKTAGDKIARHFVIGGELPFSKNFQARVGYNHLRRREMQLENAGSMAGFSFGILLRIRAFQLDFSRATYALGGAANALSVNTNLGRIFTSKSTKKSNSN